VRALLADLLARWVAEAAERGDRAAAAKLAETLDEETADHDDVLLRLREEPEEPIGSPWRVTA
jgi:hypothetical protein